MNIVVFCGGRGAKSILTNLLKDKRLKAKIYCIVNPYDDGKSTGKIRNYFKMFGPSDIRKVQSALLDPFNKNYKLYKAIFDHRINKKINKNDLIEYLVNKDFYKKIRPSLKKDINKYLNKFLSLCNLYIKEDFNLYDWSIINILYVGVFYQKNKIIKNSISEIKRIFEIKHDVFINSNENLYLSGIRENGIILPTEASIVEQRSNISLKNIYLTKKPIAQYKAINENILEKISMKPTLSLEARSAVKKANLIIYAPGTQFSSLYPSYLSKNIGKYISNNKLAKKFFITNIGADYETPHFKSSDYITNAYKFLNNSNKIDLNELFDYNLINIHPHNSKNHVAIDKNRLNRLPVANIFDNFEHGKSGIHNGLKIIKKILKLISHENSSYNINL